MFQRALTSTFLKSAQLSFLMAYNKMIKNQGSVEGTALLPHFEIHLP